MPKASTGESEPTVKTSPGRATGSGRNSRASAKLKMAQLAPMPIARDKTAMVVKPGLAASSRKPYRRSCHDRSSQTHPRPVSARLHHHLIDELRRVVVLGRSFAIKRPRSAPA